MNKLTSLRATLVALALSAAFTAAHGAITLGDSKVQLGGFFSQGWLHSSANNYPTASKGGTWDFREFGLNVSTTIGSHLRVGAQGFAQRFGNLGEDRLMLDWAGVDYNFRPELGLRLGRVKYPKGLYGEALDLDALRPFVFLPNAVYSAVMRDFSAAFNGAMLYGSVNAWQGSFDYKIFHGDIPMTPRQGVADFYGALGLYPSSGPTQLGMDSVSGGQLVWNTPVSGLKFAYSYSAFKNIGTNGPFAPAPMFNATSNIAKFAWHTFSAEYLHQDWTFAAEYQTSHGLIVYSAAPVFPRTSDDAGWDGWYVSAARRFAGRFEAGAYYGDLRQPYDQRGRSDPNNFQKDFAVSLRCDLNEYVTVKAEYHRIDGVYQTFNSARIPNPVRARRNDLIAVKTTFGF